MLDQIIITIVCGIVITIVTGLISGAFTAWVVLIKLGGKVDRLEADVKYIRKKQEEFIERVYRNEKHIVSIDSKLKRAD